MTSDQGVQRTTPAGAENRSDLGAPLRGVKILDFSIAVSGPYSVALLADQGASVVKVERPGIGDIARWLGVSVNQMSALFVTCNRGKRSIALDLAHPEAVEIARRLAAEADVVVENFRTGVMERLGLGYDALREVNEDLIYVSVSGYGPVGPYADRSAYDTAIQAYSGVAMNQSDPERPAPVLLRQAVADKVASLFTSQAITAALFARERGDGGQHVHLAMADAAVSFLWVDSAGNEVLLDSDGTRDSRVVGGLEPMTFRDGWGIVVPTSDDDFVRMCEALDVDLIKDPRIATRAQRDQHPELTAEMIDMCYAMASNLTQAEATARFDEYRLPFAMVVAPADLPDDEHAQAVGMFVERDHPVVGRTRIPRHPVAFGQTAASLADGAPALGQHTDEVLTEIGMADAIHRLRSDGVVA